jgi:hypothetical protein
MAFEIESKTVRWLVSLQVIAQSDCKQLTTSTYEINEAVANMF